MFSYLENEDLELARRIDPKNVGMSADAARKSACATMNPNVCNQVRKLSDIGTGGYYVYSTGKAAGES
jgi:hypothetical protein